MLTDADDCTFTSAVYLKITKIRHKETSRHRLLRLTLSEIGVLFITMLACLCGVFIGGFKVFVDLH